MNGDRTHTIWTDTNRATKSLNPLRLLVALYHARGSLSRAQFQIVRVCMLALVIVLEVVVVLALRGLQSQLDQLRGLIGLMLIVAWLAFAHRANLMRLRDLGYEDHEIWRLYTPIVCLGLSLELSLKQGETRNRVALEDADADLPPA